MNITRSKPEINYVKHWSECDWTTYYDPKREVENNAMRLLKTQTKLLRRLKGRAEFSGLELKVLGLERSLIRLDHSPQAVKYKIALILNLPYTLVERVLQSCTLIMYYREFAGLPPIFPEFSEN